MALDRVWQLFPRQVGGDEAETTDIWVEQRFDSPIAVAPISRTTTGGLPVQPNATTTIRTRYRRGLSLRSQFVDEDDVRWYTNGLAEIGRRQWIDLSVSAYDVQTGQDVPDPMTPSGFTAPAGWHLETPDGNPVQQLVVGGFGINDQARRSSLGFTVPPGGWQVALGETIAQSLRLPVTILGSSYILKPSDDTGTGDLNNAEYLTAGALWPGTSGGFDGAPDSPTLLVIESGGQILIPVGTVVTVESADA